MELADLFLLCMKHFNYMEREFTTHSLNMLKMVVVNGVVRKLRIKEEKNFVVKNVLMLLVDVQFGIGVETHIH